MNGALAGLDGWALLLALARVAPLVLVAPALGGIPLPRVVQAALALVIALVVAGGLAPAAGADTAPGAVLASAGWATRVALLGREVMIGATLGVVAAVPLLAAAAAGAWAATSHGGDDAGVGTWSWFFPVTAAMVFFAVGGHLAVIGALGMSYRALPVGGSPVSAGDAVGVVAAAGAQMIAAGLALAAPLVVAAMLAALLAGVVERAAGLPVELVPESAVRRAVIVLAAAAALVAIAMIIAGDARALPDALTSAIDRLTPSQ